MQQATTLRTSARATSARSIVTAVLVLSVLATIALLGLSTRAPHTSPTTAVVANPAHNRLFDGETRYVASASEYAALGETYANAAVTGEYAAQQPIVRSRMQADEQAAIPSAAEYANGIWGEDYRIPSAASAPVKIDVRRFQSRTFADEANASMLAQAYSGLMVGEDYLPLADRAAPGTPAQMPGTRSFADQQLDVVSAAQYAGLPFAEDYSLAGTPR